MEQTDEELVDRVDHAEQDGFSLLFERYRATVHTHVGGIVRGTATADDLTQEVFLRLWHRAAQWKREAPLESWLRRIGTNLALNHLRTIRRRREQPMQPAREDHEEEGQKVEVPAQMIDVSTAAPDEALSRSEHRRMLQSIVGGLPHDKQVVMRMVDETHMENRQVADELRIPVGTVKSRHVSGPSTDRPLLEGDGHRLGGL